MSTNMATGVPSSTCSSWDGDRVEHLGVSSGQYNFIPTGARLQAQQAAAADAVEAELSRWTRLLLQTPENARCIDLTSGGPYYQLPNLLTQPVYLRKCYKPIFDGLFGCDVQSRKQRGLVLTGTPGIGKSVFAVYIIWRLAQVRQVVFYQYGMLGGNIAAYRWDFRDPQNVTAKVVYDVRSATGFCGPNTWLLMDDPAYDAEYCGQQHAVVLAQPNDKHFRRFLKGSDRLLRFMPCWKHLELEELRQALYSEDLTSEQMAERFRTFGGVPRLVLEKLDVDPSSYFEQHVTPEAARQLLQVLGSRSFRNDLNHMLGHYSVDSSFKLSAIVPVSPTVLDAIICIADDSLQQEMRQILTGT
eukprot:GHUV01008787.1.p1 GENE.GHUV01008787.1~~GHUV01008787.1.p1  ORF type:complete len:358 (+),score=92.39 GHUV01008787.1:492-1565(+)